MMFGAGRVRPVACAELAGGAVAASYALVCAEAAWARAAAALAEGARTVSLGYLLGPVMRERQAEMFATDHFHPSAAAYAIAAQILLPPLLTALQGHTGRPAVREPAPPDLPGRYGKPQRPVGRSL